MATGSLSYDVVVVGGGAAGLAAAVSAARAGARTALIERYGFLGGMATAGMVSTVCGLYLTSAAGPAEPLNPGFADDVARRLAAMPGCAEPVRRGRTHVLPYTPFAFACLADQLTASTAALDVYLHTFLTAIDTSAARVEAVRVATWERVVELTARAVVDASGDAVLAHLAGAVTVTTPLAERQLPSLVFVLQHVDTEALGSGPRVALLRALVAAEQEGRLPKGAANLALGSSPQPGEIVCKLTLSGITEELPASRDFLTVAEQEGRKRAFAVTEFLKTLPPFARAFVSHAAPQVGVRESRRVIGRYQLTRDDVLSGRKFDDGVARASWPIELWEEGRLGATYEWLDDRAHYDIPLRCLQARDVENLFVAGRCMSATHEALGSARVIGTCLAAGEAVGRGGGALRGGAMNLAEILFATAERHSPRRAVTDVRSGRSVSYGQLAREAERLAAVLKAEGVGPGQRIGLLAPNDLAYLPAAFGLLAAGACFVPLASNLTPTEIAEIVREVQLNGCLSWPKAAPLPFASDHADASARRAVVKGGECEGYTFQWIDRGAEAPAEFSKLNAAFIRFTSGTTSRSKGVVLSHEATGARVEASDRVLKFSEEDRILWVLPLAYHFAVTITAYVRAGAHILLCPDTLPKAIVEAARRHRASVLYAAPLHFERMANLESREPLSSIRVTLSTAAPISPVVMERFESVYGVPVGQAYGIIEAGLPCINLGTEGLPQTSVGRPVPGYAVSIFSDDGHPQPPETLGEIGVRGDGLFSAYYSPWRLREQVERDGWFLTGDFGFLDRSGALHLKGRKKALILVAGLKFFPEEVEDCINQFPGIKESRVFGRPHARMGEVPCAEIAVDPAGFDLDALKSHCSRALSSYKVPLEFTIVDAVPRTPSGKIRR